MLLLEADSMFPEGAGKTKAVAKTGAAAKLTNELVWNAKEAVDEPRRGCRRPGSTSSMITAPQASRGGGAI